MAEESPKPQSWWQTLTGILTAVAGIITPASGLIVALTQAGVFHDKEKTVSSTPTPTATLAPVSITDGATSVGELEKKLGAINIKLGARPRDEETVRGYLAGPDPEYRSLALGCLQLIGNQRLKKTLHLDIIDKHYTSLAGGGDYLSADGKVNLERVKEAMVKAQNDYYSDSATSFEDIVESR